MTVRDIAKKAGVSATTVSLVLNKKDSRISEKTRERILTITAEHQYRPNKIAVSLATNKTNTLGVIVPDLVNLFYASMISGIENYAQRKDYSLLLCSCSENIDKCIRLINTLEARCVDGIILISPGKINEGRNHVLMAEALGRLGKPYVLLEHAVHDLYHDFVTSDNMLGGYIATKHLIDLGHKKIGCITGPLSEYGAMRRLLGYRDALEENQIVYDEELVYNGDFQVASGIAGAEALIKRGVTALFCGNDMMAQGVLITAEKMGIAVPRELSVVGYDNNPVCELLRVPLTTVAQPVELMGKAACELLLSKIADPRDTNQDYYFTPTLIRRASTAPPGSLI
jgi:LacI family transcriptional regulator